MNQYQDLIMDFISSRPMVGTMLVVAIFLGVYFVLLGFRLAIINRKIEKSK